jgi:PAS domain S-box-containing protein
MKEGSFYGDKGEILRLIMDAALDAIICIDLQGAITFWNPQSERIFGWKEHEVLGKKLSGIIIPERYRKQHEAGIAHYHRTGYGPRLNTLLELHAINKWGEEFPIELTVHPIKRENDEFFCAYIRDITERKKAEHKLIDEKELSESIINSLPGVFYLYDENGKFLRWNTNFVEVSGYTGEEISKMHPLDFFDDDEKALLDARIGQVFSEGKAEVEAHFRSKNGKKTLYYFNGRRIDFEGRVCLIGMGIDITERKQARETIQQAQEDYRSIFENAIDGIYQTTPDGRFITANQAMATMLGFDSAEELMNSVKDINEELYVDSKDRDRVKALIESNTQQTGFEFRLHKKNHEVIWVRANERAVKDKKGRTLYFEGMLENITERKIAEDKLKSQFEELQKTNFELDHFVYSVSHDLRAPLTSVMGLVNIAELENISPTQKEYWSMVRKSVVRLDGFIKDILDYSSNSRTEIRKEKINFSQIIEEVKANFTHNLAFQDLTMEVTVDDKADFYSDTTRIEIILNNLLSNAIKYADRSKPVSRFSIDIKTSLKNVRIVVADNGVGIEKHHLDKIFEMFYKASSRSQGSGLGLYIAKETVSRLGGTISVTSEPFVHTTFDILIPNRLWD